MNFLNFHSVLIIAFCFSSFANAAVSTGAAIKSREDIENSCRAQAKITAAQAYRSCVIGERNSQIEQIRNEYKEKLQALKAHYEAELKKMSSAVAKSNSEKAGSETVSALEVTKTSADESTMDLPEPIPLDSNKKN